MKPDRTLAEYMQEHPDVEAFHPRPHCNEDGDFLSVFFEDKFCYAQRVDDLLTLYHAEEDGRTIGFKIKGIKQLSKHVAFLMPSDEEEIDVNMLILSAVGSAPVHRPYYEVGDRARGVRMNRSSLPAPA